MSEKYSVKVFCPAHVTGFFIPEKTSEGRGALGAGINLTSGIEVILEKGNTEITLNGVKVEMPPVHSVMELLKVEAKVRILSSVPAGCGFGVSGASALATAVGLNELYSMNISMEKLVKIAHISEVKNRTGLGDVSAQKTGGLVVRKSLLPDGVAVTEKFLVKAEVDAVVFGEISTEDIISEEDCVRRISKIGRDKLKKFLKKPSLHSFFRLSKEFSIETGLADDEIIDAIEAVETEGGMASMAMLGRTVFAIDGKNALEEFGDVISAEIDECGVRLV